MKITRLRVSHLENPLGFDLGEPSFSWVVEETAGSRQQAARLQVAADPAFAQLLYDSGEEPSLSSLGVQPPLSLTPRTRYWWRVWVRSDAGEEALSDPAWFETGKQQEPWQAAWVTADGNHPLLRGAFTVQGPVRAARAYVCGLGLYELSVNGHRAGQEYLAPFCNDYNLWLQVQTYDITGLLQPGENVVGAALGKGWYMGRFGFEKGRSGNLFGSQYALLCELHITLADGREQLFCTGDGWQWREGPVTESGIYDGEWYDARRQTPGWDTPACPASGWQPAAPLALGYERLCDRMSPPVVITERLPVWEVIHTPKGETVLDFGQELTGWVEFFCDAPAGAEITLSYFEILQEGCYYRENLRTALQEYHYISAGSPAAVRPHFTFYGFRYVKVEGLAAVQPEHFTACVVHSDLPCTGQIATANPYINCLFRNIQWGQRGNFLDVPTDCPQRDERMGWTGDAQIFCGTACFNRYTPAFYAKYLRDMLEEQTHLYGGSVPHVVPMMIADPGRTQHASCAWADAAAVIPWTVYLFTGDLAFLRRSYPNMTAWVDYLARLDEQNGGNRLWQSGFHYADWLALDNPDKTSRFGGTDPYYIASGYYAYSAGLTARAARALGRAEDAARYEALAEEVRAAFQKTYLKADGLPVEDTQTALVVALFFELCQPQQRPALAAALRAKLEQNHRHLNTGFVGTPYLCRALSAVGENELAYTLLLNDDFPSWLYEVKMGATTIWERWNSVLPDGRISDTGMNSLNHYAYGSVAEWMYRDMCGLNPDPACPGFKRALIAPKPDRRLEAARAVYDSAAGRYESGWRYEEEGIYYTLQIPFDATAQLTLQGQKALCNGVALQGEGGVIRHTLPAGRYEIFVEQ